MFHVGDLVMCVEVGPLPWRHRPAVELELNRIYTIAEIEDVGRIEVGVRVEEVETPNDIAFWIGRRFRPVKKTDISVFRKIMQKVPEGVT